ncbi:MULTISPECIES: hypothetical protein [unclassified Variovorax]|uniref:hypothetical protein n=1 Tax=unclassified Variovorax TaxID=663243 RepID=UPI0008D5CD10|nr:MULTISPECIES: hypothetical protein [unclassified Variovorax]SEJ90899.1 hypothetical protein SAMN05518853_104392 [Variovorax sp. OK202]SFD08521.1 hypothetical protein SAMN05444746_104392 [Variovorax sp. OK212]
MRDDMDKVIVERPRGGWRVQGDGRQWRNSRERGSHLGMKRGYGHPKWLSENLAPLKRWLHKQVHRPWDKVYADLCSGIDRRSTVQAHVFEHIGNFVERAAVLRNGEVRVPSRRCNNGPCVPLREAAHVELFVHPVTGILLPNRRLREAREAREARAVREQACREAFGRSRTAGTPQVFHVIDDVTQWHRVDGCWFEITLAALPELRRTMLDVTYHDVLRRCAVTRRGGCEKPAFGSADDREMYGRDHVYAAAMRRLSQRVVRERFAS